MSEKFPSQMQDKFTVRFPDGLRDAIAEKAKEHGRSMNSEIVQVLEDYLSGSGAFSDRALIPKLQDAIKSHRSRIDQLYDIIEKQSKQSAVLLELVEKFAPLSDDYKKKYLPDDKETK